MELPNGYKEIINRKGKCYGRNRHNGEIKGSSIDRRPKPSNIHLKGQASEI
jgi:hypothetical protein